MTTSSPYEHRYQFPPQALSFHYRVGTRIRTKLRRMHLWLYRHLSWSRRNLFSSLETTPVLPAIPATPRPPLNLTATIWPTDDLGEQITRPLQNPLVHIKTQEETAPMASVPHPRERVTQPLVLRVPGEFGRAWSQEFHSGKHPSVCTEAALGKLAQQRPFPDIPAWHPAHPEKTLKRIRLVKPSLTLPTTAP